MSDLEIWADGASCGNSLGPGGWCALLKVDAVPMHIAYGGEPTTTNNVMELLAALRGLQMTMAYISLELPGRHRITLISDSEYVTKAYSDKRIYRWAVTNFMDKGKDRPNAPIWREMWETTKAIEEMGYHILTRHVDGHTGVPENEFCDSVAKDIKERLKAMVIKGGTPSNSDQLDAHQLLRHARELVGILHDGD